MTTARFLIGDVFDVMATLPDQSVDLVLTSPPFLALRSYLPPDHPDKAREIGSEPDPATFLDTLLRLTAEWGRLLAPHGSIAVELGDTYAGSGGAGGDYNPGGLRDGQGKFDGSARRGGNRVELADGRTIQGNGISNGQARKGEGWPLNKSLCILPHLYAASLAYGRNLLREPFSATELLEWIDAMRATGMSAEAALAIAGGWVAEHGEPFRFEPWRVRNVVAWCRPNPPVGALGDKFRPATSYITIATRARDRWFDLDAVRGGADAVKDQRHRNTNGPRDGADPAEVLTANYTQRVPSHPNGAPPLDWWEIPTEPYKGSHYATWPRRLLERPIKAMCPMQVCTVCGEPRRRIVEATTYDTPRELTGRPLEAAGSGHRADRPTSNPTTLGWTDCGHDSWRTGVVLDPFGGSGTTGAVATGLGRDCILIDLDERNAELAVERIGMFCTVEDTRQAVAEAHRPTLFDEPTDAGEAA